jgi:hypothetical protein
VEDGVAYVSIRNEHVIRVYDVSGAAPAFIGQAEANFMPDTLSLTNDKQTLTTDRGPWSRRIHTRTA